MMMTISLMNFLIKKHFINVLFFIYYNGGSMQIEFNEINRNNQIIDIRSSYEFENDNIPGSINVTRINLLKSPDSYMNKQNDYYLLCNKGEVSLSCARILNALGYHCYSIIGGMDGLKKF